MMTFTRTIVAICCSCCCFFFLMAARAVAWDTAETTATTRLVGAVKECVDATTTTCKSLLQQQQEEGSLQLLLEQQEEANLSDEEYEYDNEDEEEVEEDEEDYYDEEEEDYYDEEDVDYQEEEDFDYLEQDTAAFVWQNDTSILDVLNPDIINNRTLLQEIATSLQSDQLVVLRDAFRPEFANYVWQDLNRDDLPWEHFTDHATDGFSYSHHNIYDANLFPPIMAQTDAMFNHAKTRQWIANLTGRATSKRYHAGSASWYQAADYSLPHTDWAEDRTVAYVWHLSSPKWQPAWGGALYWCGERRAHEALQHASYNTLMLFSVTRYSEHLVTVVSPHVPARHKRLAWNGWWRDDRDFVRNNNSQDTRLLVDAISSLDTYEARLHLTADQSQALMAATLSGDDDEQQQQQALWQAWQDVYWHELNEPRQNSRVVDLYGQQDDQDENVGDHLGEKEDYG